jgi:hypothetical protein
MTKKERIIFDYIKKVYGDVTHGSQQIVLREENGTIAMVARWAAQALDEYDERKNGDDSSQ